MATNNKSARLDGEWLGLTALRDVLSTAARTPQTYDESIRFAQRVAPSFYSGVDSLIAAAHEPPEIRRIRQEAAARSQQERQPVSPVDVVNEEIAHYDSLLKTQATETDALRRTLRKLQAIRERLSNEVFSEGALIVRDVFRARHIDLPVPRFDGARYTEYQIGRDRAFRIRMLHPDRPEHVTGADVVYDLVNERTRSAHVAFIQYKIWEDEVLYFSAAGNLVQQLARLKNTVCEGELCRLPGESASSGFRMPHCGAFLRPTDRLQRADARLISSGEHVPICKLPLITEGPITEKTILRRPSLLGNSITQGTFVELFVRDMLGSRPISISELEALYRRFSLLGKEETLFIHAQEVLLNGT